MNTSATTDTYQEWMDSQTWRKQGDFKWDNPLPDCYVARLDKHSLSVQAHPCEPSWKWSVKHTDPKLILEQVGLPAIAEGTARYRDLAQDAAIKAYNEEVK